MSFFKIRFFTISLFILLFTSLSFTEVLSPESLLSLQSVSSAKISPDGIHIAYTVRVPRQANDEPGGAYCELHVYDVKSQKSMPFISGKVSIGNVQWHPDGKSISFTTRRDGNKKSQLYCIPLNGGEARQVTDFEAGVSNYKWHPKGDRIAFIATEQPTAREKALKKKGYGFIYYEENLKHKNLYCMKILEDKANDEAVQLTKDQTVWNFQFSNDGASIAFTASEKNLIDYNYMFREIYQLDLKTKSVTKLTDFSPRKIGNYCFSPNGKNLAIAAALDSSDHAVSQAYVLNLQNKDIKNITPDKYKGHINHVEWKDDKTLVYQATEGTDRNLYAYQLKNGKIKNIFASRKNDDVSFRSFDYTDNFKELVFVASSGSYPDELFFWKPGKKLKRLTDSNPVLNKTELGKQEVFKYKADDGQEVEGLLIYPVEYKEGEKYPLVVIVHGGPESNYTNGWVSRYATPGQVLAGKGYLVFYPNYRASTGYGLDFAKAGLGDAAGREFDDIRDGILALIDNGLADKNRVGLGGGSYGGYASAWFATYYTKYVNAVCMFVGISDLISKRGTTDIPYEELYVHSANPLEEMWQQSLERSPIYYAHQSKTATLIFGGAADPRVHPSQSLELYRRMKMNNHPAVRLVQYPGEGHGNRNQPGQIDVLYRVLDWYDWYVKDNKALDGEMSPLDISDKYGLELPE